LLKKKVWNENYNKFNENAIKIAGKKSRNKSMESIFLRKQNGSIMIVSLVVFSIIVMISTFTMSWILYHNKISKLEKYDYIMREQCLSGVELLKGNIYQTVSQVLENSNTKSQFEQYFLDEKNYKTILDISSSELKNTKIIKEYFTYLTKGYIFFEVISETKIGTMKKQVYVYVRIKSSDFEKFKAENKNDVAAKSNNDVAVKSNIESNLRNIDVSILLDNEKLNTNLYSNKSEGNISSDEEKLDDESSKDEDEYLKDNEKIYEEDNQGNKKADIHEMIEFYNYRWL
jgi:hypothetical protein